MDIKLTQDLVVKTLEDGKARDIQVIDVAGVASFTDCMVVATGTSTTHVRALANMVAQAFKEAGEPSLGVETSSEPEWALIDQGNVVIHILTEKARAYYAIEKLWQVKDKPAEKPADNADQNTEQNA